MDAPRPQISQIHGDEDVLLVLTVELPVVDAEGDGIGILGLQDIPRAVPQSAAIAPEIPEQDTEHGEILGGIGPVSLGREVDEGIQIRGSHVPGVVPQHLEAAVISVLHVHGIGIPQNGRPIHGNDGGLQDIGVAETAMLLRLLGIAPHRGGGIGLTGAVLQDGQRGGAVLDRRLHLDAHKELALGVQLLQKRGSLGAPRDGRAVELHLVGGAVPGDLQGIDLAALIIPRGGVPTRTHADQAAERLLGVGIGQKGIHGADPIPLAADEGHPAAAEVQGAGPHLLLGSQGQSDPLVGVAAAVVGVVIHAELEVDALLDGLCHLGHDRKLRSGINIIGGNHGKALGGVLVARFGTVVAGTVLIIRVFAVIVAVFVGEAVGSPVPFRSCGRGGQGGGGDQPRQQDGAQKRAEQAFFHIGTVSFREKLGFVPSAIIIPHFPPPRNCHFHKKTFAHLYNFTKKPLPPQKTGGVTRV